MSQSTRQSTGFATSVYSPDRLEAIGAAVQGWFNQLPIPKKDSAEAKLGVSQQAVYRWRTGGGPRPCYMYLLWKDTGNTVFLLTSQEKMLWKRRNQEVQEEFPNKEDYQQFPESVVTAPDPPMSLSPGTSFSLSSIEGQLKHGLTVLQALMISLEAMAALNGKAVNANVRQQAVKNVLRLIRVFGLAPNDFKFGPQEESDPGRIETLRQVFAALGMEQERGGSK